MEDMSLVVPEKLNALEVFTGPEGVEKILSDIEEKCRAFKSDVSTAKGRKEIASMAYKVSQSKTLLDSLGKDLVSQWKKQSAAVDASRKMARDRLDALRDETRQPLTEWEEAEAAREAAEKAAAELRLAEIEAHSEHSLWLRQKAIEAKEAELAKIEAERLAKEQAEAEAQRQKELAARAETERKEREERIRQEAAEAAQREAQEKIMAAERKEREAQEAKERTERERADSEKRAEEARLAAEAKAKEAQEQAVRKVEERLKAEARQAEYNRVEKERLDREEAQRKADDVEHRRSINNAALEGLKNAGLSESEAKKVITAIASRLIPHIKILY